MVIVTWVRCERQNWCRLETMTLAGIASVGVYIIWYAGDPGRVVCSGQGNIAAQLARIRGDKDILSFRSRGTLLVTWAAVSPERIDGIERYLVDTWPPLIDGASPDAKPIEVNSPAWMRPFLQATVSPCA